MKKATSGSLDILVSGQRNQAANQKHHGDIEVDRNIVGIDYSGDQEVLVQQIKRITGLA